MLRAEDQLLIYYFGFGYVILLGWLCLADEVLRARTDHRRARLLTIGKMLVIAGLLNPAFALAGRDVIRQLRLPADPGSPRLRTHAVDLAAVASVAVAVAVVLIVAAAT